MTRTPRPAVDVAPDIIPPPRPVDAMEDNTSTTAVTTAMQEVDQEVVDMSGYSMDTGTSSCYTHQPYSTNNLQSDIQSSQTSLSLLSPIPTAPLQSRSLHPMPTNPIKVIVLSRCLHPPKRLSQTMSLWYWHSPLLPQLGLKGRRRRRSPQAPQR